MNKKNVLVPSDTMEPCCNETAGKIFADLDAKLFNSGVFRKIAVRSLSHIRKRYGVGPKTA